MVDDKEEKYWIFILAYAALIFAVYPMVKDLIEDQEKTIIVILWTLFFSFVLMVSFLGYKFLKHRPVGYGARNMNKEIPSTLFAVFLAVGVMLINRAIDFAESLLAKYIDLGDIKVITLLVLSVVFVVLTLYISRKYK